LTAVFRELWMLGVGAMAGLIVLGSVLPLHIPGQGFGGDKLGHGFMYFALALAGSGIVAPERLWIVLLRCLLLGAALEVAQELWTDDREGEWRDLLANGTGVLAAWLIVRNGRSNWARHIEGWLLRR
jgi:VanZ family protein